MAFYGNDFLQNIVFTKKIGTIGNGAFSYCHSLKKTNIQVTKVKRIQDYNGKTYGLQRYFGHWLSKESRSGDVMKNYDLLEERICGGYNYDLRKWVYPDNRNYFGTFQGAALTSFVMSDSIKYMGKQSLYPDYNRHLVSSDYYGKTLKKLVIGKNFMGEINGGQLDSNDRTVTLDLHFIGYDEKKIR